MKNFQRSQADKCKSHARTRNKNKKPGNIIVSQTTARCFAIIKKCQEGEELGSGLLLCIERVS